MGDFGSIICKEHKVIFNIGKDIIYSLNQNKVPLNKSKFLEIIEDIKENFKLKKKRYKNEPNLIKTFNDEEKSLLKFLEKHKSCTLRCINETYESEMSELFSWNDKDLRSWKDWGKNEFKDSNNYFISLVDKNHHLYDKFMKFKKKDSFLYDYMKNKENYKSVGGW